MLNGLLFSSLVSAFQLANVWTVETNHPQTALQEYQEYRLGGLVRDDDSFYLAGSRKSLEKRNLTTGEMIWSSPLQGDSQALWTLEEGVLYGGDTRGSLYAIESKSGAVKWTAATKGIFVSAPEVKGNQIWTMNSLGVLQSYERSTGQWLWQQTDPSIGNPMLWSARGPLLIANQIVAGFPSALIQAFQPDTGQLLWKDSFQILPGGSDSFNDLRSVSGRKNELFASSFSGDLKVWTLEKSGPKTKWQKKISLYAPVTFDSESVILSARDGSVRALDVDSGLEKWKYELPRGLGSQPVTTNRGIWIATTEGEVYLLSKEGKLLAKTHSYESPIWNPPLVVQEDEVIVMTARGILRKLRISEI